MRKIALSTILLLLGNQALADTVHMRSSNLAQIDPTIDSHLNEYAFSITSISDFSKTEIRDFWLNKKNGEYCTNLFNNIVDGYANVEGLIEDINSWIDEYNEKCSDKCLPGYVRCQGGNGQCVKECDCCASLKLTCCSTSNHPYSYQNYAEGEAETLYCYDWCCDDDQTRCQDSCISDAVGLPYGYGNEDPGVGSKGEPILFPKVCCQGQDCCDPLETFIQHLTTSIPFCCELNTVLNKEEQGVPPVCCCQDENAVCCPGLRSVCQPASNKLCCEQGYSDCHGECWPDSKPCCDAPAFNCPSKNDACVEYCCCGNGEKCCEERKSCIPDSSLCCPFGKKECYGQCISNEEYCCPKGQSYCEYSNGCKEDGKCCDEVSGFFWCPYTNICEKNCCPLKTVYCEYTGQCLQNINECCAPETPYCRHTDSCSAHCCEYSEDVHNVYCDLTDNCEDECECCPEGTSACLCKSGAFYTDKKCYSLEGEECCDLYWCDGVDQCLQDQKSCCSAGGNSYVGKPDDAYDGDLCCPSGSTHFSFGVAGENSEVGCCSYNKASPANSNCCRPPLPDEKSVLFEPSTGYCVVTELPPCPCEGCCDFNCCDELDYFMHLAFYDHYHTEYYSFIEFYEDWYQSFYSWWHSPTNGQGTGSGSAPY